MRSRSPRSWPLDCAEWLAARRCRVRNSCVNARRPWRAAARLRCVVACGACRLAGVPGAVGPGRCVCWWVAARPRAVRATSFARRVGSKPGQALPPPSGTAASRMPKGCPAARPRAPQSPRAAWSPHRPPRPRSRPCARAGSRSGYEHTKSPGPNGPGDSPSGWRDLNPRPLRPERSALPSCATPRCPMSIAIPRRKTQTEIGGQWEVCATPQR